MKHAMIVAAAAALLTLTACSGDKGPTKEDGVKVVEGFFTEQGRQATLQRSWRFEVTDAGGLDLDCEKKPNGDQECMVGGSVKAQGSIGGQPTKPEPSTLKPKLRALFRPQGEGWQPVEVKDEGTSAG
ncbi:hypothetical protein LN96_14845 [Xanthomonas citri pv. citri]|uniref:hypothetical protein n=1 Tax=Lysobacteraceae TaxID=32033 RepID=UPI00052B6B24|nr:hypothetical protein [Xanthomonas citri]MBN5032182.1 hypothetical protein [Stenotrophomonas maltophilia]OMG04410.1 hypothetical protein LN96_14845 [Xanthomonas citri pv. citri]PIB21029.1 hypothetical protein AA099_07585 [Xanthomonas citri pv. citri]CEE84508.1 conserved exported hypothetical protein [Xanthomonas citri pv. citri]CEH60628.1 conserved exported hypothetical protein [Xanthomonas citri pv. citri]